MLNSPHGGNLYQAAKQYGLKREELLDFSANINPLGVPDCIRHSIISGIDDLANYPDPECTELKAAISQYLDISENKIIVGNGASEIIFLLFSVLKPRKVLIPAPSFAEYARAAQSCGIEIKYFELKENNDFKLDIGRLMEELSADIGAVILCNPNNPTSTLINRGELEKLLQYALEHRISVILDETFIELTVKGNQNSMADVLKKYDNLFIIRAFTKLFAIPGLRMGYGLGCEDSVKKMWERKLPWSVNTFACSLGAALREGREYLEKTAEWLYTEMEWLYHELSAIPGLKVFQPNTNFVLLKILCKNLPAGILKERMAGRGILIRDASNFEYLNEKFFRVAVKNRESNSKLIYCLKEEMRVYE